MGIYLYVNWVETELKNAYIWYHYEYSYDFRNKNISQVDADWWTYSTAPSFDANWMYMSASNTFIGVGNELTYKLTPAKKVTFNFTFVVTSSTLYSCAYWIASSDSTPNFSWIFFTGTAWSYSHRVQINTTDITSYISTDSTSTPNWTYTQKVEYDLENKTYTYSWTISASWTLTNEQISAIRNYNWVMVWVGNGWVRVSTIDLTIDG